MQTPGPLATPMLQVRPWSVRDHISWLRCGTNCGFVARRAQSVVEVGGRAVKELSDGRGEGGVAGSRTRRGGAGLADRGTGKKQVPMLVGAEVRHPEVPCRQSDVQR